MYLLYDDQPRLFSPTLAKLIDLNNAIVLQQVHFRLQLRRNHRDGRYWVYDSAEAWQSYHFPWWSLNTVKRTFAALEEDGLLIARQFERASGDCRKWYSIEY